MGGGQYDPKRDIIRLATPRVCHQEEHMDKEFFNPPGLNKPPGYTHAVTARGGKHIFIAGQTAWNAQGELVGRYARRK